MVSQEARRKSEEGSGRKLTDFNLLKVVCRRVIETREENVSDYIQKEAKFGELAGGPVTATDHYHL